RMSEDKDTERVPKGKAPHSEAKNLHNKYAIAEELSRGQFGIVHRCVSTSSEKTYMAKFVKVRGADQAIVKKEIATLNLAKHTNFLLLHESFDSPEELVMIYDFISGADIFERINIAEFELNEREIVNYIRQICSALEFLHSRHLTPGEQIKIQYTTAEYAAPEIHQCDMVSSVTDMWSVGVLAYVLLSGLNPFIAETNQQMIDNISNAAYSYDDESFKQVSVDALDFTDPEQEVIHIYDVFADLRFVQREPQSCLLILYLHLQTEMDEIMMTTSIYRKIQSKSLSLCLKVSQV
uniref:Protein kinase domain-containing protein n=1 Tax=Labrus bergylta TaxID=56723 RepID=A0A3Q3GKG0_9LABR